MPIEYPKTISVSGLHDIDTEAMYKEICNRYNSHELLCNEIERLEYEKGMERLYKIGWQIFGIACMVALTILTLK